jgi:2C-methyl-D-erythritol 2,4-cyclodiphosphate synthase
MWTQQEIKEQEEFDYSALFNSVEVEEELRLEEIVPTIEYKEVKILPTAQDMKHQMARLLMMQAGERGEYLSYRDALNF